MSQTSTHPTSNTPFDDAFKTMQERMPFLMIPVINEAFGTDYDSGSEAVILKHTEHHTLNGKIIGDSNISVSGDEFHFECQSTPDSAIPLRLVEYIFAEAMENALVSGKHERTYCLNFPRACVLFLRGRSHKIKQETVILDYPDGTSKELKIPAVRLQAYSLDEIQEKKLFFFLPFYFMRYETDFRGENTCQEELLRKLDHDFQAIEDYMYQAFYGTDRMYCYPLLNELISKILDVIIPAGGTLRKEVDNIMGGHCISTPTTIALDQGYANGHKDGMQQGMLQGKASTIIDFIKDGIISIRQGAEKLHISEEEMQKMI